MVAPASRQLLALHCDGLGVTWGKLCGRHGFNAASGSKVVSALCQMSLETGVEHRG